MAGLTWVINKIRRKYYLDRFNQCKGDPKKTWSNINALLGRGVRNAVRKVVSDDGSTVEGLGLVNYFNDYFTSIASNLTESLPRAIDFDYFDNIQVVPHSCFLVPTDASEVTSILQSMPNKGNSLFDVRPNLLLKVSNVVVPIIVYLYNLGISIGLYPDTLKIGRVVAVFKSGEAVKVNNYRPITVLTTINKVFELLTHKRMTSFIDLNDILSHLQFGFRKGKSTTRPIFEVVSDLLNTFHEKTYTIALFLDLTKAFDTVNKEILMHKLSICGFRGVTNSFLNSYMTDRKQYVYLSSMKSDLKPINVGVPQGSVLGPLLFNIFINDIVNVGDAKKVLFADDAVFYVTAETINLCIDKMRTLIGKLSEWLRNNKLIPNVNKTKLMMFTPRPVDDLPDIFFDGKKLEWVPNIKYLGMTIDNKLNFSLHTQEVYRKLSKYQGIFYSLSSLLPQSTLLSVYYSLVYPVIIQNVIIWGGVPVANLRNINVTINKILRYILKVEYDDNNVPLMPTNNMYKTLKLLKFEDIYRYFLLKFLHFSFYNNNEIFRKHFLPLMPRHTYSTRNTKINLPTVRLEIEKQFTIFQCCKLLNDIPEELIVQQTDTSLKNRYKSWVLCKY